MMLCKILQIRQHHANSAVSFLICTHSTTYCIVCNVVLASGYLLSGILSVLLTIVQLVLCMKLLPIHAFQVKCVSVKKSENTTVYFSLTAVCAGTYTFIRNSGEESVSCDGARFVKSIVAVAKNDDEGSIAVNKHPDIISVMHIGYECALKHHWSKVQLEGNDTRKSTTCRGVQNFQLDFQYMDENSTSTLNGMLP